jgi:thiol-disulfide isomerase/thioredoxin
MKIYAPALALGLSLLCNICPLGVTTAGKAIAADRPAIEAAAIDAKADALLHKVSDFYAGLKSFHVTLQREAQKSSGGDIPEMKYKIETEKPAKLSIKIHGGTEAFDGGLAKMDGEKLYLYNPLLGYVSSKAPTNFDDLVRDREFQFAMAHSFHGQNLLEALLTDKPYQFLMQHYGINWGSVAGQEKIDGVETEHLVLKSHRLAYDIWVQTGSKPWVRRVSTERSKHEGEGKTVVFNYENPSDSTKTIASDFVFAPPSGAKEVQTFFTAKEPDKQAQQPLQPKATEKSPPTHPLINKPAPKLTLDTLGGGKMDLASLKSKNIVVLDFWATWCPPCRAALPILAEVTKSYEEKGVKFFAIDLKEAPSKIQDFLKKQGLTIDVALDKDGQAASKYSVEGIPQSVIIDKDGIVRVVHEGFSSDLKARLTAELDEILAGKTVTE